jgi:hypothetical protein
MRSILRATKNVVEQNTTKGDSPTGVLANPEAALAAAGAVTVCYTKWRRILIFTLFQTYVSMYF